MPKSKMDETEVETVVRLGATDVRDVFPDISADDADSRVCLLCNMRLKDKTHNLTRHLERHHLGALLQLVEQRNAAAATAAASAATSASSPNTPVKAPTASKAARTQAQAQSSPAAPPQQSAPAPAKSRRRPKRAADIAAAVATASIALDAQDEGDYSTALAASASPSSTDQVDSATQALVRWLMHEQLPLQVVASDSFQRFVRSLNASFDGALALDHVQRTLAALHAADDDAVSSTKAASRATKRAKREVASAQTAPIATTRALVARCRVSDDVPRVQYEHLPCRVLPPGYVRVRVQLALASVSDLQTCLGRVRGRVGVLGHAFVGVATHVLTPSSAPSSSSSGCRIAPQQRVVLASPQLPCVACVGADQAPSCTHTQRFGSSSFSGALAQYVDVPIASVAVLPSAISDAVGLLTSDVALALEVADALTQRAITHVAVVTDGAGSAALALLVRYLHATGGLAREHIHVFATAALSHLQQAQLEAHAMVTLLDVQHPEALDDVLSEQLAFDGVVDLCSTNASTAFAISLVQPMGAIVLVDRARLHGPETPTCESTTLALNMNAIVVNELEVVSLSDSGAATVDVSRALVYLAELASAPESMAELEGLLMAPVELDAALKTLRTLSDEDAMAQYLPVRCSSNGS